MSKEFSTVHKWLKICGSTLFHGYSSFILWDTMEQMKGKDIVGPEAAKRNVDTMNRFHYFFVTTMEAHKKICFTHLYKLFDTNRKAISLRSIINFIRTNKSSLEVADFQRFHKDRFAIDSLASRYTGVSEGKLKECEDKLDLVAGLIGKLSRFRHTKVSHNPMLDEDAPISVAEIEQLFDIASEILKEITYNFDFNVYQPYHHKETLSHQTKSVIEFLGRFEPYRLKEIDENVQQDLEKMKNEV